MISKLIVPGLALVAGISPVSASELPFNQHCNFDKSTDTIASLRDVLDARYGIDPILAWVERELPEEIDPEISLDEIIEAKIACMDESENWATDRALNAPILRN